MFIYLYIYVCVCAYISRNKETLGGRQPGPSVHTVDEKRAFSENLCLNLACSWLGSITKLRFSIKFSYYRL